MATFIVNQAHTTPADRDSRSYDPLRSARQVSDHFERSKKTSAETPASLALRFHSYLTGISGSVHDCAATKLDLEIKSIVVSAAAASFFELKIDTVTVLAVRVPAGETVSIPLGFSDYVEASGAEDVTWTAGSAAEVTLIGKTLAQITTLPEGCGQEQTLPTP